MAGLLHSSLSLGVKSVFPFILSVKREIGFILGTGDEDTHGAKKKKGQHQHFWWIISELLD